MSKCHIDGNHMSQPLSFCYLQRMKKGPGGKSKGGEGKMKPEGSDKENGSGDRKSEKPENKVEAFLDICESLLELEKEALEQRENDLTLEVVAGMMKEYCEQAFALAKDEEKKR